MACYFQESCTRQYLADIKCKIDMGFSNGFFFNAMLSNDDPALSNVGIVEHMLMLALSWQQEAL